MLIFPGPLYCRVYEDTWLLIEGGVLYLQVINTYHHNHTSPSSQPHQVITLHDHCISFIDGISSLLAQDDNFQDTKISPSYHDLSLALTESLSQVIALVVVMILLLNKAYD